MKNAKDCYKYILNNLNIQDTFLLEVENKKLAKTNITSVFVLLKSSLIMD